MTKPVAPEVSVTPERRPTALLRIGPVGLPGKTPRDYLVALELSLAARTPSSAEVTRAGELLRASLDHVATEAADGERPSLREVRSTRHLRGGGSESVVTGVYTELRCAGRPSQEAVDFLRSGLAGDGYLVTTRERRPCAEPDCTVDAQVDSSRPRETPQAWFNEHICGRHNYRACAACRSVYRMLSSNAIGPAPSVHCEVCGAILVEWGGSKLWEAELLTTVAATT